MMDFSIAGNRVGDSVDIVLEGELDVYTSSRLRETLTDLASQGVRHITVDVAGVDFVDSTALGVLVGGLKRMRRAGGDLVLRSPRPSTLKVLQVTGLGGILKITDHDLRSRQQPDNVDTPAA